MDQDPTSRKKPDPASPAVAQPAQNGSCDDADTKSESEPGLTSEVNVEIDKDVKTIQTTRQKNEDDSKEEATSDSSKQIDDTSDDKIPKEVVGNRDSDKHDAPRGRGVYSSVNLYSIPPPLFADLIFFPHFLTNKFSTKCTQIQ